MYFLFFLVRFNIISRAFVLQWPVLRLTPHLQAPFLPFPMPALPVTLPFPCPFRPPNLIHTVLILRAVKYPGFLHADPSGLAGGMLNYFFPEHLR